MWRVYPTIISYESEKTIDKKEVKEETLVLGTREYIGYIGGSLGLLLGFSCYAYITKLIDKVLDSFLSTAW